MDSMENQPNYAIAASTEQKAAIAVELEGQNIFHVLLQRTVSADDVSISRHFPQANAPVFRSSGQYRSIGLFDLTKLKDQVKWTKT